MQFLPLLALALARRRWPETTQVRLTLTAAASYGALFALLLWQALRGQPFVQPDGLTIAAFGMWLHRHCCELPGSRCPTREGAAERAGVLR